MWIEIKSLTELICFSFVTSLAEVWIEICFSVYSGIVLTVTSLAEVWIEISIYQLSLNSRLSLPLRKCGLKSSDWNNKWRWNTVTSLAEVWIEIVKMGH